MVKTRSMTRKQNHDGSDASSSSSNTKRIKTFDNNNMSLWSDVNHDVLFLVTKKLGFVDFLAFSGVCKSWRSFAVSNKNMFLPPMSMRISTNANDGKDSYCHLADFEGRSFKTILPHSAGRICIGTTCGYLILYARETRDFWLVNPITSHELHFPKFPLYVIVEPTTIRAILVFSPSISGWVFVVVHIMPWSVRSKLKMLFCIAGKRRWNRVTSTLPIPWILDLQYFKGKIYTVHIDCSVRELRLDPKSKCKSKLPETMIFLKPDISYPKFVSTGEKLYMISQYSTQQKVLELDFGEMKWVLPEKTLGEYAFFTSSLNHITTIKPLSSGDPLKKYKSNDYFLDESKSRKCMLFSEWMWYFSDECLNLNVIS